MLKKSSNPPVVIFILSLIVIIVMLFLHACRKLDKGSRVKPDLIREKFFNTSGTTNASVLSIAALIKRQDAIGNFVPSLVQKAGYPRWDKSRVSTRPGSMSSRNQSGSSEQLFIPFVSEEEDQTKAILIVKINGTDTLFHLQYDTRYHENGFEPIDGGDVWHGQQVFAALTLFDHQILGYSHFQLFDNRVLNGGTDTIGFDPMVVSIDSVGSQISSRASTVWEVTTWITFKKCNFCYAARQSGMQRLTSYPCCNVEYYTVEVTYWIEEGEDETEWEWFPVGDTGGGGSSCIGCDWTQTNPCTPPLPGEPWTEICDESWQPVPNAVAEPFDVNKFDSVGVSDEIRDSFPCVYEIIKDNLWDINKTVQIGFHDFFTVNQYNHIFFKLDYSMCGAGDTVNGKTSPNPTRIMINGNQHFIDTISLNPCFLSRASREAIVGTIIHESIHAYIEWCLKDYERYGGTQPGYTIDSFYLKEHFPLHWDYIKNNQYSHAPDHDQMVNDLVNYIASEIYTWGNPNAPTALRQWVASNIAKIGLHKTSAWGKAGPLSDTCSIKAVEHWSNYFRTGMLFANSQYGGPGCRYTFPNFRDSLQLLRSDSCQ